MMKKKAYQLEHFGSFDSLMKRKCNYHGQDIEGKIFLDELFSLKTIGISLNAVEKDQLGADVHTHDRIREMYIFTAGHGLMNVEGEVFEVSEGAVVDVSPGVSRGVKSLPETTLQFICIRFSDRGEVEKDFGQSLKHIQGWSFDSMSPIAE